MNKLISQQVSSIISNNLVVGNLPNTSSNDILIYNKRQTEKKLKDIKSSDKSEMLEITKAIAQWGYALGITVVAQDLVILNNFVRENFSDLNVFDLKLCVKLVSTDSELLDYDAEHYGKLTMIYVSKVLKAYQSYRGNVCFNVREKIIKFDEQNKPKISEEQRIENFKKILINGKEAIINDGYFEDFGEIVYNFIRFNKLIKLTDELQKMALEYGENEFLNAVSDSRKGNMKKIINDVSFSNLKKEDMVNRGARRYVSQTWLKNMNLEDMLKKINYEMLLY